MAANLSSQHNSSMSKIQPGRRPVLISWLAVNNDPFGRDGSPGPTLTFLCNPDSPYRGVVDDAVIFYNQKKKEGSHYATAQRLIREIENHSQGEGPNVHLIHTPLNPVDHKEIFDRMRGQLQDLREKFPDQELAIHVSPGTPAMHTAWVLLAETGSVEEPFRLLKTVRRGERRGRGPVQPIEIGLETPLRRFQTPAERAPVEDEGSDVRLDPAAYQSELRKSTFDEALRYAQIKVPILILGERGTGKSQLADWIRLNSPFRNPENDDSPPKVACGQFSGDLVRSEIFGHQEGAFTGATSDRDGLMEKADGDTLFLDEVGDLTPEVQRLLIRAVENKEYTPHGSDEVLTSDFRLVTATNLNWEDLRDRLAADFLDRISYFTVEMPPLRETPEDLPILWKRVLRTAAERADIRHDLVETVNEHQDTIARYLRDHPLRGNFRDLFRLAYYIFAYAVESDVTVEAAVEKGVQIGLSGQLGESDDQADLIRKSFGQGEPLPPDIIAGDSLIETSTALDRLRRYLATEIRRLNRTHALGEDPGEICDVSSRSLQKWMKY